MVSWDALESPVTITACPYSVAGTGTLSWYLASAISTNFRSSDGIGVPPVYVAVFGERYDEPRLSMTTITAPCAEAFKGMAARAMINMIGRYRMITYFHLYDI